MSINLVSLVSEYLIPDLIKGIRKNNRYDFLVRGFIT